MLSDIVVRELRQDNLDIYRAFRLRGLKEHPEAFTSSFEEESAAPPDTIRRRLARDLADGFILGAFDGETLVGVVGFERKPRTKERHKGHVFGMYVAREIAGRGVGRLLLETLIDRARRMQDLEQLQLTVSSDNTAAVELYKSIGFISYGRERNAINLEGRYVDKDHMAMQL